jgi:hypothetical protein
MRELLGRRVQVSECARVNRQAGALFCITRQNGLGGVRFQNRQLVQSTGVLAGLRRSTSAARAPAAKKHFYVTAYVSEDDVSAVEAVVAAAAALVMSEKSSMPLPPAPVMPTILLKAIFIASAFA